MGFSKDFVWGAATSSFQIEGAAYSDGKGEDIWNAFCKEDGKVFGGHNGDTACDHYNRMEQDVKLMSEMGLKAYRFSINWARIFPKGTGEVNPKGLDFYGRLIDELLKYGIEPYITLYHWELPYELHKRGGWLNPEIAAAFGKYAAVIAKSFSDRVTHFITLNEPQVFVGCGYLEGSHAPGYKLCKRELLQIGHNVLRAHGEAVKAIRENSVQPVKVGIVMATSPAIPETESDNDVKAAIKAYTSAGRGNFIFTDDYWLDPVVFGKYAAGVTETCADILPEITDEDLKLINQPIDFIGENIYRGNIFRADKNGNPEHVGLKVGFPRNSIGWELTYDALYWGARHACERYKLPYYITENGMAAHDAVSLDGQVHDPNRTDYMHRYLLGFRRAAEEGYPVSGYFAWSLMDNFEWAQGYNERFGLVFVDFDTQERIVKDSAKWYKTVIEENGDKL